MWIITAYVAFNTDAYRILWVDQEDCSLRLIPINDDGEDFIPFDNEEAVTAAYKAITEAIATGEKALSLDEITQPSSFDAEKEDDSSACDDLLPAAAGMNEQPSFILLHNPNIIS